MRIPVGTFFLLVLVGHAALGQQPEHPSVELPAELTRVLTDYEGSYGEGGAELAALFTEDGFVLSGGARSDPRSRCHSRVLQRWRASFAARHRFRRRGLCRLHHWRLRTATR